MKHILNLAAWKKLKENGFEEIRFLGQGKKLVAVGAALRQKHISITGETFYSDIICIEPHNFLYSKDCYYITGKYIEGVPTHIMRFGRKEFAGYSYDCNTYVTAREILKTIELLKNK